jgi:hypothetical protein
MFIIKEKITISRKTVGQKKPPNDKTTKCDKQCCQSGAKKQKICDENL